MVGEEGILWGNIFSKRTYARLLLKLVSQELILVSSHQLISLMSSTKNLTVESGVGELTFKEDMCLYRDFGTTETNCIEKVI